MTTTTPTSTPTRHHRVPCSLCLVTVRTDSGIQADRARHLTEAGVSADEVERLLPTCPRCLRRRLRDLAVLEVMLRDFPKGGNVRSIAKSLGMRPWSVVASIGRLEGEGKLRGEWGWDRARRCLRWQAEPAGPSEAGGGARFSTLTSRGTHTVRPSDQETHTV
jgi:ribosomal protein L34E